MHFSNGSLLSGSGGEVEVVALAQSRHAHIFEQVNRYRKKSRELKRQFVIEVAPGRRLTYHAAARRLGNSDPENWTAQTAQAWLDAVDAPTRHEQRRRRERPFHLQLRDYLTKCLNSKKGWQYCPSYKTLATRLGCSEQTISQSFAKLEKDPAITLVFVSGYLRKKGERAKRCKMMCDREWLKWDDLPLFFERDGTDRGIRNSFRKKEEKLAPTSEIKIMETPCSVSGEPVQDRGTHFYFPGLPEQKCWKQVAGREMTAEEYVKLIEGETLENLTFRKHKTGEEFTTGAYWDKNMGRVRFRKTEPAKPTNVTQNFVSQTLYKEKGFSSADKSPTPAGNLGRLRRLAWAESRRLLSDLQDAGEDGDWKAVELRRNLSLQSIAVTIFQQLKAGHRRETIKHAWHKSSFEVMQALVDARHGYEIRNLGALLAWKLRKSCRELDQNPSPEKMQDRLIREHLIYLNQLESDAASSNTIHWMVRSQIEQALKHRLTSPPVAQRLARKLAA